MSKNIGCFDGDMVVVVGYRVMKNLISSKTSMQISL